MRRHVFWKYAVLTTGSADLKTPLNKDGIAGQDGLAELLRSVFGFARFRASQEAVCRAAIEGRDLLLVMPTGSGKSLCYQLPAIARGGTALVISPLIALMEDQAAKLAALGLRGGADSLRAGARSVRGRRAWIICRGRCSFCLLRRSGCGCRDLRRCWRSGRWR